MDNIDKNTTRAFKSIHIIIVVLIFTLIIFIYYTREDFLLKYTSSLDDSENAAYVNFVSRNPIIDSDKDVDNNSIEDWNDSINEEFNKKITFDKSEDNPKDFDTNLTDMIVADMAVASSYIKKGKASDTLYDAIIDNLVKSSRFTLADAGENIKFSIKSKYSILEEREFLKNIDNIYFYIIYSSFSESVIQIFEEENISSEDKVFIQKNNESLTKICITLNDPSMFVIDKYKDEYKSLLQTCLDSLYIYNAILNKDTDPARSIAASTIFTDMNVEIYENITKIKQKIPKTIDITDTILLKQ